MYKNIAIYSRKSKITETGDSIKNQVDMCKDYAKLHFGNCQFTIYEDEGFSGKDIERPMFKKMMKDVKNKKFEVLMCYRLDRISRNVNDFSNVLELLEYNNISFVSLTEQFDTSTPLGKAMLSIASVFAELERNTIAQRITDNFTELAKKGYCLIANPPEGYKKIKVYENDKCYNVLAQEPEEAEKIKLIFEQYLQLQSNSKVETYCLQNDIKTKSGNIIKSDWLTRILSHELYAVADINTYEYFKSIGANIYSDISKFDGIHGINVFRKTKYSKGRHNARNEPENLIITVGQHEGIIKSENWVAVQNILNQRKHLGFRKTTGRYGILNGMLRCSKCGDYMRPFSIRNGKFFYVCVTKEKSRKQLCNMKNLKYTIEEDVIMMIRELLKDENNLSNDLIENQIRIKENYKSNAFQEANINKKIKENEKIISNLILKLSITNNNALINNITLQVEKLDEENKNLKIELAKLEEKKELNTLEQINFEAIKNAAEQIKSHLFDEIEDNLIKRNILKTIIKQILWDGKNIKIEFV